jgi:hypothetical protein
MSTCTKSGGTLIGDATNLLIPIGLLAAREGIQWYKGSSKSKSSGAASSPKKAKKAAASAKPKPKPKASKAKKPKRSMRGGEGESYNQEQHNGNGQASNPVTPQTQQTAAPAGQSHFPPAPVNGKIVCKNPTSGGAKGKVEKVDPKDPKGKGKAAADAKKGPGKGHGKASNPDAVIKMARDAIKGHLKAFEKKRTSSGGSILAQFVAAADKISRA